MNIMEVFWLSFHPESIVLLVVISTWKSKIMCLSVQKIWENINIHVICVREDQIKLKRTFVTVQTKMKHSEKQKIF